MNNKVFKQRIIPQNWSLKKVSEIAKTGSGGTPLSTCKEYYDGGNIPWINSGEVGQNSIKQTSNYITKAGMENSSAKIFPAGSVLLALYGATAGKTSFLEINATTNQAVCAIMPKKGYDAKFIKYYLDALYSYLVGVSTGSARDNLNQNGIQELEIPFPCESTQKRIAKVLSDLDAKIELNNRINRELETMAKTLYDYWFVQFDFPNEQGKPYKSSGGNMVYNAELKREIPEGWEVKKLSEIANITMGQSPEGSSYNDDGIGEIFFQGSTDFGWRYPTIRKYTTQPSRRAKAGDILLSVRAPVGTLNIADNDCCIGRGLAALNSKSGYDSYLYYVMEYFKQIFDHRNNTGTTFGSITKDDLFSLKLVYPKDDILKKYNQSVFKYNQIILNNHKQNQQLTALRDWLLPMLMNGQVTVKEAEERLSMAAEPSVEYKKG